MPEETPRETGPWVTPPPPILTLTLILTNKVCPHRTCKASIRRWPDRSRSALSEEKPAKAKGEKQSAKKQEVAKLHVAEEESVTKKRKSTSENSLFDTRHGLRGLAMQWYRSTLTKGYGCHCSSCLLTNLPLDIVLYATWVLPRVTFICVVNRSAARSSHRPGPTLPPQRQQPQQLLQLLLQQQ